MQENKTDLNLNDIFELEQYQSYFAYAKENGYYIKELDADIYDGQIIRKFKMVQTPERPNLTYAENRARAYPDITEQLDMIYWDKINNTNIWIDKITEIKTKYPKI